MLHTYRYRIYPTPEQEVMLSRHFGCARWVYNYGLNLKIETYKETKKSISRFEIQAMLPILKKQEDTKWLGEVQAQSLQASLEHLERSYKNFFRSKKGFPKFKSKYNKQSYQYPQNVRVDFEKGIVVLPKIGKVKCVFSRRFTGTIKTCTVSKTPTGKYFISILVDIDQNVKPLKIPSYDTTIGIDTGIKTFVTCSNGYEEGNPKFLKQSLTRLKVLQRRASRKVKGSQNRRKANLKVAVLHEYITNQRLNLIHQVTHTLTSKSQASVLCVEDLNVSGMMKNHKLAQSLSDVSLSKFYSILEYKCKWQGINLVRVDRWFPSSKMCSCCGAINQSLLLSDRVWTCACGVTHDRDPNAATNLRDEGYRIITTGAGRSGEPVESLTLVRAWKQEIPLNG